MTTFYKTAAVLAALEWVGVYEAETDRPADRETYGWTISLGDAFDLCSTPAKVKRRFPGFPEGMVDAFAMLRRQYNARTKCDTICRTRSTH